MAEVLFPFGSDDFVDQFTQVGIAMSQPAARRDAVGLVIKFFRRHFVEVGKQAVDQQFGMQAGNAVDGKTTDNGEVSHPDMRIVALFDQRHVPQF